MFDTLGRWIGGKAWVFILAWVLAVAGGAAWSTFAGTPRPNAAGSFLPPDSPHNRAVELTREAFPALAQLSYIVIIAERTDGLTAADYHWLHNLARDSAARAEEIDPGDSPGAAMRFLSPAVGYLKPRLVSPDNQAAMAIINIYTNYLNPGSLAVVEAVEELIVRDRPKGLTVEITGPSGIGRDYFEATRQALDRTTLVTIAAVLIILIIVYRSPIGAFVPLISIGMSVYLAFVILAMLQHFGWVVSNLERIFAIVLLFGAGVDFALFWIARYREELNPRSRPGNPEEPRASTRAGVLDYRPIQPRNEALDAALEFSNAARIATARSAPAIVTSGATTICGLSTLMAADLVPWQTAGRVLAPILGVSLLAAITLTPAIARVLGRMLFWPLQAQATPTVMQRRIWPAVANFVVARPAITLFLGLIIIGVPAAWSLTTEPQYDSLAQLPPGSSSQRGQRIAYAHFDKGNLFSNTLLLRLDDRDAANKTLSAEFTKRILDVEGVAKVYSLDQPFGRSPGEHDSAIGTGLTKLLGGGLLKGVMDQAQSLYLSPTQPILRFEILIDPMPFTKDAMRVMETIQEIARNDARFDAMMTGFTPYIMGVRDIASGDQQRVMVLATLIIALIVFALIRNWPLTGFMMFATWLTFGATITLTHLLFVHGLGYAGLDYKVRLIVFVIIVAVGQDYNIFLVTRLLENRAAIGSPDTVRQAIVRTGSVISSCGVIMAATLGSLWAGGLSLLQQIGFALALGILIDTFLVRPLLVPSFFLLFYRKTRLAPRHAGG